MNMKNTFGSIPQPPGGTARKPSDSSMGQPSASLFVKRSEGALTSEVLHRPSLSYWKDAWQRIKGNKLAMVSAVYVLLLALTAAFLPPALDYSHDEIEEWAQNLSPNLGRQAVIVPDQLEYQVIKSDPDPQESADSDLFEPPMPPASLKLMSPALTQGIAIRWTAAPQADSYLIYRSINKDTPGIPLAEVSAEYLSHLDDVRVDADQKYYYRVYSANSFGESEDAPILEVQARLALTRTNAMKFADDPQIGQVILTKPHYLGTDYLGRDMLARVMIGARVSLFIGFGAPLLYILIGVIYGCISGYFGGLVDDIMMRIADIVATIPELLTVIMLQVFLGSGIFTLILALVIAAWARSARQLRGEVLKLREAEFVQAGKVLGTSTFKIILRHLLPNTTGTILVLFTLAIPQAIFTEAFLSFIGLGIKPPMASWGSVTREGAKVWLTYPHELLVPATMISVSILAFNLLGDGLRDALDPKLRGAQ
jgi:oligopeptide transport system permease protein